MKKRFIILVILFFIQGIVTNIGHPITPSYINFLNINKFMFGIFFATMSLGSMLGAPFWGNLGDTGNKKKYIIIGILLYAVGQLFFGLGLDPWLLIIFRFISGFGVIASTTLLTSEMISINKPEERAKGMAFAATALTLGGSVGYYFGGLLNVKPFFIEYFKTDIFRNVFIIQAIFAALFALLVYLIFNPLELNTNKDTKRAQFWEGFKDIKKIPVDLLFFLIALTLITFSATNISRYLDVMFTDKGFTSGDIGTYQMVVGFVSVFASLVIVPLLVKIEKQLLLIASLQVISSIIIFFVFRSNKFLLSVYTLLMLYMMIKAVLQPIEQQYISNYAIDNKYGQIMGIRQSFFSLGTILGPLVGGVLYDKNPLLLFDVAAIIFLVSTLFILISSVLKKRNIENKNPRN